MELSAIGKRIPLEDAYEKVAGKLKFAVDISLPGMLHAKVLRSPYPHARIINPSVAESQVVSGVMQGCGLALCEKLVFDENTGQILNPNFVDYKIFKAMDIPDPEVRFVEEIDPVGAFGVKGIGEGTLCPCPATLAQAIYNATGVEFNSVPFTPEIVFRALKGGAAKEKR